MNINYEIIEQISSDRKTNARSNDLYNATENIVAGVNASVQGYFIIGQNLDNINVKKLWQNCGFSSFAEYTEKVLGISKATAYRIIAVTNKFLKPEISKANNERIFSPFQDTALAALNPVGDYNTTAEFIAENNITPETPVSEIRKIVSEFQKASKEVDAECENESNGEENETKTIETQLQQLLNQFAEEAFEILADKNKPKSKRKKTPLKKFSEIQVKIIELLDVV